MVEVRARMRQIKMPNDFILPKLEVRWGKVVSQDETGNMLFEIIDQEEVIDDMSNEVNKVLKQTTSEDWYKLSRKEIEEKLCTG